MYRDGHQKRRSAGTYSHKKEAERKGSAAEESARKNIWRDPEANKRTWGQWCDEWWPTRNVAASTLRADAYRRDNHLKPRWEDVPLGAINRHDVKAWAVTLSKTIGPETVKRCVHLLSGSLVAAIDAEIIESNPAARLKLPGAALAPERYLTDEEYEKVRAQLSTENDRLIADLLVNTGLRWGEMAGLHVARVDLDRGLLRVTNSWDEADGEMKEPKGKRVRDVPIIPELVKAFSELERVGQTCGYTHKEGRCPGPLLMQTAGGAVLRNQKWAAEAWRPAVENADVGHVRPHDLRHTYASWLLQRGVDLAEVGELLGHISFQTTQRYAHLTKTPSSKVLAALAPQGKVKKKATRKPHAG